jgi:hypothetical protein
MIRMSDDRTVRKVFLGKPSGRRKASRPKPTVHMLRMSDDRTVRKVFLGKTGGRRKAARPKLRWLNRLQNDVKLTRVKR